MQLVGHAVLLRRWHRHIFLLISFVIRSAVVGGMTLKHLGDDAADHDEPADSDELQTTKESEKDSADRRVESNSLGCRVQERLKKVVQDAVTTFGRNLR